MNVGRHSISPRTCRERREPELDTAGPVHKGATEEQTGLSWSQERVEEREEEEEGGGEGKTWERDRGNIRLSASWGRAHACTVPGDEQGLAPGSHPMGACGLPSRHVRKHEQGGWRL